MIDRTPAFRAGTTSWQVAATSVQLPRVVPPSRKLTLPVAAAGLTVAVKAMAVP